MMYGATSGAQDASAGLFESCLLANGFQKVPNVQPFGTKGPSWLDEQRILAESEQGKHIKQEIQNFVAIRQQQINHREAELQAKKLLTKPPLTVDGQDITTRESGHEISEPVLNPLIEYQAMVRRLRREVEWKKDITLSAFYETVQKVAGEVNQRRTLPDDPNLAVIQILDTQWQQSQPVKSNAIDLR
jgi:Skp family chaperone for outer membrane proteins